MTGRQRGPRQQRAVKYWMYQEEQYLIKRWMFILQFLAHALHLKLAPARPARGSGTRGRESDVGEGGGGL